MMEYRGYHGKVEYDPEANILHGEVIGIRDVITFQARSVDEIEQAFHDSVDDYLEFCEQRGEKPEKPCSGKLIVRIPSEVHRKLTVLAELEGRSINSLISDHLQEKVERDLSGRSRRPRNRKSAKPATQKLRRRTTQTV